MLVVLVVSSDMRKLDSVRPTTEGHPSAAGKGGKFWQSTGVRIPSLPLELIKIC
nr:MAG TPA: hypothetical protein [Caudoviricetes sp.]